MLARTNSVAPARPIAGGGQCSTALTGLRTFDVGPGKTYADLNGVPWRGMQAGDVVNVYYRAEPYRSKIGLQVQGTAAQPFVLNGVTSASCEKPVITGIDAVTPNDLKGWFDAQWTENLGVITMYHPTWGQKVKHVKIQNVKVTGGHPAYSFTNQLGVRTTWSEAAGIYAVTVEDLTLDNVDSTDNAFGVFTNTKNDNEQETSYRLAIRRSHIWDNGVSGSFRRHNVYAQAVGCILEDSWIGQLRPGAIGSSYKSRCSGDVIRRNRIDAAARAIDLVEHEGGAVIFAQPDYNTPIVEDNVIVSTFGTSRTAAATPVHFGGDNGWDAASYATYKRGPMTFRRNVLAFVNTSQATNWQVTAFDLPRPEQVVYAESNVIYRQGTSELDLMNQAGNTYWQGANWISTAWKASRGGTVNIVGAPTITGADPGLGADYKPLATSASAGLGPK